MPGSRSVRQMLSGIPTDADFDAFCFDCFPTVHARFSAGMDRVQKTTLLLQLESDHSSIARKVIERFGPTVGHPSAPFLNRGIIFVLGTLLALLTYLAIQSVKSNGGNAAYSGTILTLDGHPLKRATVILLGTPCVSYTSDVGYFDFGECQSKIELKAPQVTISTRCHGPMLNIPLNLPPLRTLLTVPFDSASEELCFVPIPSDYFGEAKRSHPLPDMGHKYIENHFRPSGKVRTDPLYMKGPQKDHYPPILPQSSELDAPSQRDEHKLGSSPDLFPD